MQPRTKANRGPLTAAFSQWLVEVLGVALEQLFQRKPFDHEAFCEYLISFGNDLYSSGRPYWHFAETINSLTSLKPSLRRQVQGAWDLAYTWLAEEPYEHHTAMPAQVIIAVLSTCLLWGWIKEAGIFALCWGALLRAGEAVKARSARHVLHRGAAACPAGPWKRPFPRPNCRLRESTEWRGPGQHRGICTRRSAYTRCLPSSQHFLWAPKPRRLVLVLSWCARHDLFHQYASTICHSCRPPIADL